jgi:hypothetical protein
LEHGRAGPVSGHEVGHHRVRLGAASSARRQKLALLPKRGAANESATCNYVSAASRLPCMVPEIRARGQSRRNCPPRKYVLHQLRRQPANKAPATRAARHSRRSSCAVPLRSAREGSEGADLRDSVPSFHRTHDPNRVKIPARTGPLPITWPAPVFGFCHLLQNGHSEVPERIKSARFRIAVTTRRFANNHGSGTLRDPSLTHMLGPHYAHPSGLHQDTNKKILRNPVGSH